VPDAMWLRTVWQGRPMIERRDGVTRSRESDLCGQSIVQIQRALRVAACRTDMVFRFSWNQDDDIDSPFQRLLKRGGDRRHRDCLVLDVDGFSGGVDGQ